MKKSYVEQGFHHTLIILNMAIFRCARCGIFIKGDGVSKEGKYYHKECLECAYCGAKLTGTIVTYKGKLYHNECNPASGKKICAFCRKPISGSYYDLEGKHYHKDCYHKHVEKICSVCGNPITGIYTVDDWGNCAHVMHGAEKTKHCDTCGRIIAGSPKQIGNNAVLCSVCATSSVTTSTQVESCRTKVLSMFKSFGIKGVPEDIPIKLKNKDLMEGAEGHILYSKSGSGIFSNFRIEITYSLPMDHFLGVLAHELLHSWLVLYGREVTDEECEGFCNLGCAWVYQKINTDLSKYLLKQMYKSEDTIYGDGYRLQKERFEKLGWEGLLESLRHK
jgi:hypothetical protein